MSKAEDFAKSLALWTLFHTVAKKHPDADFVPWIDSLAREELHPLAALSARRPDDPAALRILREASAIPDFAEDVFSRSENPARFGLDYIEIDGKPEGLTVFDVAVLTRNSAAADLLLAARGENPDCVLAKNGREWTVTERALMMIVAGEGRTSRSAAPVLEVLFTRGSSLGPVELESPRFSSGGNPLFVADALDPKSATWREIWEARGRAEKGVLDADPEIKAGKPGKGEGGGNMHGGI